MTEKPALRAVLSYYGVDLHSQRREQSICCPVHEESHPSCSVNEDAGLLNCMACGFGGDVFSLIMAKEGLSEFRAAVAFAEEKFGGSYSGVPSPTRRPGARVPGGKRFAPRYRNSPVRSRPLSSS